MMPPDVTRSMTYLHVQAMRWPLSTKYFSPGASCEGSVSNGVVECYSSWESGGTHVFADDRTETRHPQQALAGDLVHPQTLAAEHGLAEPLALEVLGHALRRRQIGVLAHGPNLVARHADRGDVAQHPGGYEDFTGADVGRGADVASRDELLHGKLEGSLERHSGRHGDHGAGLAFQGSAHRQLDGEDRVGITMADAEAPTVERAHVVCHRLRTDELSRQGRTGVQRSLRHRGLDLLRIRRLGLLLREVSGIGVRERGWRGLGLQLLLGRVGRGGRPVWDARLGLPVSVMGLVVILGGRGGVLRARGAPYGGRRSVLGRLRILCLAGRRGLCRRSGVIGCLARRRLLLGRSRIMARGALAG